MYNVDQPWAWATQLSKPTTTTTPLQNTPATDTGIVTGKQIGRAHV